MNPAFFSTTGYLSVVLWICVPLLWLAHKVIRPRRWLCHIALGVAVLVVLLEQLPELEADLEGQVVLEQGSLGQLVAVVLVDILVMVVMAVIVLLTELLELAAEVVVVVDLIRHH